LLSGADNVELALRPSVNFRIQEAPVSEPLGWPYELHAIEDKYELRLQGSALPPLRLRLCGPDASFTLKGKRIDNVLYPVEESRGYQAKGALWSPGYFRMTLRAGERATLIASTESLSTMMVLDPDAALVAERGRRARLQAQASPAALNGTAAELVPAAAQ